MKNSGFQFQGFIIKKTLIELTKVDNSSLSINFNPRGVYNKKESSFDLLLGVMINNEDRSVNIEIDSIGHFLFDGVDKENLDNFFLINAPAILFPYIRAYISSLTTLSGINPIVLPTLNLIDLKENLKSNIKVLE